MRSTSDERALTMLAGVLSGPEASELRSAPTLLKGMDPMPLATVHYVKGTLTTEQKAPLIEGIKIPRAAGRPPG